MVVDHIHDHPQIVLGESGNHASKFEDALSTVGGIGAVASFDGSIMIGVVAPIEAIEGAGVADNRLLLVRGTAETRRVRPHLARHVFLNHRGDIKGGHEVDVG